MNHQEARTLLSCEINIEPINMSDNFQRLGQGIVLTILLLLAAGSAAAQGGSISGRVMLPSGAGLNEQTRISLQNSRGVKASVYTDNQGQFLFRGLTPGVYDVVVEGDPNRFDIATVTVEVFPNSPALIKVVLKEKKTSISRNESNSVSASELDSAIPAKAKKEFERASDAGNQGKTDEAITHLRKAIEIYPAYLMARNDLGTQLLAQGKLAEAAEELQKAMKIDPKAFNPKLNLGIVLVQQRNFSEAAAVLRDAIVLNSAAPSARLYNGLALEGLNDLKASEKEFKAAHDLGGNTYALALYHLGHLYLNRGDRKQAIAAFDRYLNEAPKATNASEVKTLLATIR
jgi:Flp pilus assembly protein TadD